MGDFTSTGFQANPNRGSGSGVQVNVNGRWVDATDPEAIKQSKENQKRISAFVDQTIGGDIAIQKARANLEINDQARSESANISQARIASAQGGSARGMSRRVHRRRGPSAFAALGKLASANAEQSRKDVGGYYDTVGKIKKDQAKTAIGYGLTPSAFSQMFQ